MKTADKMAKSVDLSKRSSWRGFKICPSCGHVQAQRKQICGNETCPLRQKILTTQIPFDPVKLVTRNPSTTLYSLRSKEREVQPRNFTEITEIAIALDDQGSKIVSTNAVCYVDTCKYDANAAAVFTCKHVKACNPDPAKPIPSAEVYPLAREVLWNLNIDSSQKQRLWGYLEDDALVPAIQRLNGTTFAVKCLKSSVFPAGRLHVTALSNATASSKKLPYACACKKLKIILEADNSVVMQKEICDHLLLVLSAVLSKPNGKNTYKSFISALKSFWMPTELEKPLSSQGDAFFGLDINIGGNIGEALDASAPEDIFIFDDKFLTDDSFPDFTDIVLDLSPTDLLKSQQEQNTTQSAISTTNTSISGPLLLHAGDPNLVSSCNINEDDVDVRFDDMTVTTQAKSLTDLSATNTIVNEVDVDTTTQLELSDCNIELMDQFQLTDRIDLCDEDINLQGNLTSILDNETNSINILTSDCTISLPPSTTTLPYYSQNHGGRFHGKVSSSNANGSTFLKTGHNLLPTTTLEAPPIELPTITVVKKTPVKATQIVSEVRTRNYPHIPAKRALIVNTPLDQVEQESVKEYVSVDTEPSLAYSAWLEHIIETINESIEITDQTKVEHTFHVHEEIFSHFSKSFSYGIKRRMPILTTTIKTGKHKGLIKYSWHFPTAATVRRIFSTKNLSLQIERAFEKTSDGEYVPYVRLASCDINSDTKKRRLYPKLSLYMAHILFDGNSENCKVGVNIEWLPNIFPKSHFGTLKVEFSLGIRDPHNLGLN